MLDPEVAGTIRTLLRENGVTGPVAVVSPVTADEAVFVIPTDEAAHVNESRLTQSLTELLQRKVWVTTDGPQWKGKTVPIE